MTETDLEHSAAHQYFRSIEESFIRLRGAPLLLSQADWQTARGWHEQGVPLDLVLSTIEEVFRGREDKRPRKRPLDLRYCAKAVENAWETVRELTAAGGPAPRRASIEIGPRLAALAGALPESTPEREVWRQRILELSGSSRQVEADLESLDTALLDAAQGALKPATKRKIAEQVEISLAAVAGRLNPAEAERARERLARRVLRRHLGLPLLSLFAPELDP